MTRLEPASLWTKMFGVEFKTYEGPRRFTMFDERARGGGLQPGWGRRA